MASSVPSPPREGLTPTQWFSDFRDLYNESIADACTDLGLYYDRYAPPAGARPAAGSDSGPVGEEWREVMSRFLEQLARRYDLYQTRTSEDGDDLAWLRPGPSWRVCAVIRQVEEAKDSVLARDLPEALASGAEFVVLILYPDSPLPPGIRSLEHATEHWERRIAESAVALGADRPILLATLSSGCWEHPAPWRASVWEPGTRSTRRLN